MKLIETPDHKVRIFNAEDSAKEFKLQQNAKAFKILADGIYQNKIKAIIRELSTNARDSHIAAGHKKPFNVFLPTDSKLEFYIEDFGVGLSEEQIKEVYSTFFASDKENSNEFVGCLGLGSKTPFCYNTRSFAVESWYNGTHYIYNCFINEGGIPSYVKLFSEPTDRGNGVKIKLAVQANDIWEFQSSASDVYKHFEVKPNILGSKIKIPKIEKKFASKMWALVDSNPYVLMGGIAYPINQSIKQLDSQLKTLGLEIHAPIGFVEVDSSREGLSYTKRTIQNLNKIMESIREEIKCKVEKDIANCKTLYAASLTYKSLNNMFSMIVKDIPIQWNGKPIHKIDLIINDKHPLFGKFWIEEFSKRRKVDYRIHKNNTNRIGTRTIIIDDMGKGCVIRSKQYLEANNAHISSVQLIHIHSDQDQATVVKELAETIGADISDFQFTSKLPYTKPICNRNGRQYTPLTEIMEYNMKAGYATDVWLTSKDKPVSGIYVVRKGYKIFDKQEKIQSFFVLKQQLLRLQKVDTNNKIPTVYGIRPSDLNNLDKTKWESVWDYIERTNKEIKDKWYNKSVEVVSNHAGITNLQQEKLASFEILKKLSLDKNHQIVDVIKQVSNIEKECVKDLPYCNEILGLFGHKTQKPVLDLNDTLKQLFQKYPLISWLGKSIPVYNHTKLPIKELEKYIKAIDSGI